MPLDPYLMNDQILQCASGQYDYIYGQVGGGSVQINKNVDYGWNYMIVYRQPVKLAQIQEPASTIMLVEQEASLGYGRWFNESDAGSKHMPWRHSQHNGGSNYALQDGHCKWVSNASVPHGSYTPPYAKRDFRMDPTWP